MSIINDALKKTQVGREKKSSSAPEAPSSSFIPVKPIKTAVKTEAKPAPLNKKNHSFKLMFLAFALITILLSLFSNILLNKIAPQQPKIVSAQNNPSAASKQKIELLPFKNKWRGNELILNGIVSDNAGNIDFALINNEIYKVGESVNGKKITNITREEVTLDNNGEKITLNLRR